MRKLPLKLKRPFLTGSLSVAWAQCGNPQCHCYKHSKYRHGPYYRWTGFIRGKRTTKAIPKNLVKECKKRINNYRLFQKQLQEILKQDIENAPWNSFSTYN